MRLLDDVEVAVVFRFLVEQFIVFWFFVVAFARFCLSSEVVMVSQFLGIHTAEVLRSGKL